MAPRDQRSLVYSTEKGRMCPGCGAPVADCRCRAEAAAKVPAGDGTVRISRETKGRKGSGVTLIRGVPLAATELAELATRLKRRCSSGGTVRDGVIEIQGDHRDLVVTMLSGLGWKVKRVGVLLLLLGGTLSGSSCATHQVWQATPSPAHDLPARFAPDTSTLATARAAEAEGTTCLVHLVDPRDGTRLTLKRSSDVSSSRGTGYGPPGARLLGDYEVSPPGRYGGGPGQYLRLLCEEEKPLGLVSARE